MSDKITLDTLAASANQGPVYRRHAAMTHQKAGCGDNKCRYWLYAVILFIIVAVILAVTRPCFVRRCCDDSSRSKDCDRDCDDYFRDLNWGKLLLWSLVITLVLIVILYALMCCGCFDGCGSACSM